MSLKQLRILFITMEFSAATFSGNGVYAQDQVRSLADIGHQVCVVSAKPAEHNIPPCPHGAKKLIEVPVSTWGRLDVDSPWMEFHSKIGEEIFNSVQIFAPDVIVGIDWSSFPVYQKIRQNLAYTSPPFIWSCYRIFTRSAPDANSCHLLKRIESDCFVQAAASIVLSKDDQSFVMNHFANDSTNAPPVVIFPHIRQAIVSIPPLHSTTKDCRQQIGRNGIHLPQSRVYLTCCVRLSPEKEPHRFVEIVIEMEKRGSFQHYGIRPLFCGTFNNAYAKGLKEKLLTSVPGVIIVDKFLAAEDLAKLFSKTLLNVHPCLYDAYGMTIVEAASQGAPSIAHKGGGVGATDFLRAEISEIFEIDLSQNVDTVVDQIEVILANLYTVEEVGQRASERARSYTAKQNAELLSEIVLSVIDDKSATCSSLDSISQRDFCHSTI